MNIRNIIEYLCKYQHYIFLIISILLSNLPNVQLFIFSTILLVNFTFISMFRKNIDINLIEFYHFNTNYNNIKKIFILINIIAYLCLVGMPVLFFINNKDKYILISNIIFQIIETFWLYIHLTCFDKLKLLEMSNNNYNSI